MGRGRLKTVALAAICLGVLALGGCGAVDHFSSRAMTYNDQAETIKEQEFLENIMRAAYREPLQFSDFSQVTGQSSVSGTAAFSLPFSTFPSTLSRTYTALPSGTISGNQSFSIANLDTQEFYEGILGPIPLSSIDYYMEAGYPKALLLTLFVNRIEFKPVGGAAAAIVFNNTYYGEYTKFEAVLQAAIDLGLTTEEVNATRAVGPPLTADKLEDLKYLTTLGTGAMTLKTFEIPPEGKPTPDPNLTAPQRAAFARQHVTEYFRLTTKASQDRFCFTRGVADANMSLAKQDLADAGLMRGAGTIANIIIPPAADCSDGDPATAGNQTGEQDPQSAEQSVEIDLGSAGHVDERKFRIVITTRSVEEILYYLGEWSRAELQIGGADTPRPPGIRTNHGEDQLFVARRDCADGMPDVEVNYFGTGYCMQIDPSGEDRSSEVMEIVLQLFALNNSAKNLPSPNVISVLSP